MRAVFVGAIAALAVVPGAAEAKGLQQVLVCGADGCRDARHRAGADESMMEGGVLTDAPRSRAPFYRVRFKVGEPGGEAHTTWAVAYVPSRSLLRVRDQGTGRVDWMTMSGQQRRAYRRLTRGRRALPAARLPLSATRTEVSGALPPEVVAPVVPARAESGRDVLPLLALSLGMVGVVATGGRWLVRRRR
jgi:hypothetical protein